MDETTPLGPNNPGPYIVDGESGDADRFEPGIDDLTEPLKRRLGDYLSQNTAHGHDNGYSPTRGNAYTVPPDSTEFTFSDANGAPVPIVTAGGSTDSQHVFAPLAGALDEGNANGSPFAETQSGGLTLGQLLSKGGGDTAAPYTGNTFLKDGVLASGIGTSGQASAPNLQDPASVPVSNLVSQALLKNRWNSRRDQTPFDPEGERVHDSAMPIAGFQKKLGEFDPEGESITFEQLQNVGLSLMLLATGDDADVSNPIDPRTKTAKDLGPGTTQMGIPRTYPQVDPVNAYGAPGHAGGAASGNTRPHVMAGSGVSNIRKTSTGNLDIGDGIAPFSFGSYNNFLDRFSDNSEATLALAGALALAVGIAVKPLQLIISSLMEPVTALEALARVTPIGAMKVATRAGLPLGINLNDILARIDSAGKSPLIFTGRSSRRSLLLTPIPLENLGIVVPDNQSGLSGATRSGGPVSAGGLAPPDGFVGDKFNLYIRAIEWGLLVMFFPGTVVQSPGFYITVARDVIRSALNLSTDVAGRTGTVSPRTAAELTSVSNIQTTIDAGSDVLTALLTSKMANFLNVMTTIGNASLKQNPALFQIPLPEAINRGAPILGPSGETVFPVPVPFLPQSYVSMLPADYAMSSKMASGLGQMGRGSGYRAGNALSMLLLPNDFKAASSRMTDLTDASSEAFQEAILEQTRQVHSAGGVLAMLASAQSIALNPGIYTRKPSAAYGQLSDREGDPTGFGKLGNFRFENKIDTKTRAEVEAELDAEYMPFYFHDLRTNEIVALQAFLSTLTDNYSVSHQSTSAYGRVDDVMIYQKTKRAISISFTIACTNHADFEIMYTKINKLVTLIYPQWSPGRVLISADGQQKIVAPFSQIPTSSPVIRLRIGDIIRTNSSKFSLLRLFGVGTENFSLSAASYAQGELLAAIESISSQLGSIPLVQEAINQVQAELAQADLEYGIFSSEENNPILKSFNAVGGKGLAGVITSMNFDWLGGATWEVARYGSRAPKLCKGSIAFSPIHDIAPGIDASGMNRAPLYPVGETMSAIAGQSGRDSALGPTGIGGRKKFNEAKKIIDDIINKMIDKTGIVDYT